MSPRRRRSAWSRGAAALAGGAVLGAAFWPGAWGVLAVPGLAVLWAVTQDLSPRRAALWGWAVGGVMWAVGSPWFLGTVFRFVPGRALCALAIYAAIVGLMAGQMAATAWGTRVLALALRRWGGLSPSAAFLAAAVPVFTACEGSFPHVLPLSFAATQLWHIPLVQNADLVGGAWLAALAAGGSAALHLAARAARSRPGGAPRRAAARALTAAAAALVLTEAYGLLRAVQVERRAARAPRLHAALLQPSIPDERRFRPEFFSENLAVMSAMTREAASGGAELVVWPENTYERDLSFSARDRSFSEPLDEAGRPAAGRLADEVPGGVDVLVGAVVRVTASGDPARVYRRHYGAVLRRRDGTYGGLSAKRFPTPFGEFIPGGRWFPGVYSLAPFLVRVSPGPQSPVTLSSGVRIGPFVCYDSTIPASARRLTARGAEVLAELTSNSWWFDPDLMLGQVLATTRMRAVENRRAVLRAVTSGISAAVDPLGRVAAALPFGAQGIVRYDAPLLRERPPSVLLGEGPYRAAALAALLALLWAFSRSGRSAASCAGWLVGAEVPPPGREEGLRARFAAPNEEHPADGAAALRGAPPGVYAAVGGERVFLAWAAAGPEAGLAFDADPAVVRFVRMNLALLRAAPDREAYLRLRHAASPSAWPGAADLGGAEGHAWWARTVTARPGSGLAGTLREPSFSRLHAGGPGGRFAGADYLHDDAAFARLKRLVSSGRVAVLRADLSDPPSWRRGLGAGRALGPLSVLDLSNAWRGDYLSPRALAAALSAADGWAGEDSRLLLTDAPVPWRWAAAALRRGGLMHWEYRAFRFAALREYRDAADFVSGLGWEWWGSPADGA